MVLAGMRIARLNFSHGDFSFHARCYELLRQVSVDLNREVGILQDLPGPKIRVSGLEKAIRLCRGQIVFLSAEPGEERIPISKPEVLVHLKTGERVLIDDGKIQLRIVETGQNVCCRTEIGGEVSNCKGIVFPDSELPLSSLTEEDREALEFGVRLGVDFVAVSLVRHSENVEKVKAELRKRGSQHVQVLAKIEHPEGLKNLDEILRASDGIIVARGDLGVSMPSEDVPLLQERIVKKCRKIGKPVIVATQMLESMTQNPFPTRAEITDVAEASLQGVDGILLSSETAVGNYPVRSVEEAARILRAVENSPEYARVFRSLEYRPELDIHRAFCLGMDELSEAPGVKGILIQVKRGEVVRILSAYRPAKPIFAACPDDLKARQLLLFWGVEPLVGSVEQVLEELRQEGKLRKGERVLVSGDKGTPHENSIRLVEV